MAKFKFAQTLLEGIEHFEGNLVLNVKKGGKEAVWTDDATGAKIIVEGKNLEASEENEQFLGGGKIDSAVIKDGDKELVVSISDLNIKATKLMNAYENGGIEGVAFFLTKGDDRVIGSKDNDVIIGGDGDDVMTGKKGADLFFFQGIDEGEQTKRGPEHDVITDFDTTGDDMDFLSINLEYEFKGTHKGKDTLLTFEDGSTLLLEGVKKSEFEDYLEMQPLIS